MDFLIVGGVAFLTSILTFFSGFGVGTILTPAFVLFFPIDIAVAMTAIVHFLNNLFKMGLTFKDINKNVLIKFGITAIPLAFLGAWLLMNFSNNNRILYEFIIADKIFTIKLVELIIGTMMLIFAIFELLPYALYRRCCKWLFWWLIRTSRSIKNYFFTPKWVD